MIKGRWCNRIGYSKTTLSSTCLISRGYRIAATHSRCTVGGHTTTLLKCCPPSRVPLNTSYRTYQSLSRPSEPSSPSQPTKNPSPASTLAQVDLGSQTVHISNAAQRTKDWKIIKKLLINIWPPNDWGVRGRVVLGMGLLIAGKVGCRCVRRSVLSYIDCLHILVAEC